MNIERVPQESAAQTEPDSRMLRVCVLLPRLETGGAEVQVLHLLERLDRSRFDVSLCCLSPGDRAMEAEASRHAGPVYIVDFRWRFFPAAFVRLVRYLRRGRFDVLHCHLGLADSIGRIAGRIAGVPVVLTTEHGKHLWKGRLYLLFERLFSGAVDMRICVSHDILALRRDREGTPPDKLVVVPNAVDPGAFAGVTVERGAVMEEFGWGAEDPLLLAVGRLVEAKQYPLLVEAADALRRKVPPARCLLVGEGRSRRAIEERIELLDVGGHVRLAGRRSDIPSLLAAADLFVLSSIREGLPVALLEAMAAGKPVVGTAVGGIPDAIRDGENGILVPPGDAEALADACGRLLADEGLRRRLGGAARTEVEQRFSIAATVGRIGDIYGELYRKKRGLR